MPLTDTAIKNAKPQNKSYKLADEKSMYLLVNPNGSKYFRLKYRFAGKEKLLPIGVYPDTTLKMAREDRDNARALLAKGIDPMLDRKIKKIANTENCFKAIALEWYGKHLASKSENYKNRVINMLERDLFPWLGDRVISEIKPSELLIALRRIESRSIQTAHKALQTCGQIFRYAVATDRAELDITPSFKGVTALSQNNSARQLNTPAQIEQNQSLTHLHSKSCRVSVVD